MTTPTARPNRDKRQDPTAWPFGLLSPAVSDMGPKLAFPRTGTARLSTIGAMKPENGLDLLAAFKRRMHSNLGGEDAGDAGCTDTRVLQVGADATR